MVTIPAAGQILALLLPQQQVGLPGRCQGLHPGGEHLVRSDQPHTPGGWRVPQGHVSQVTLNSLIKAMCVILSKQKTMVERIYDVKRRKTFNFDMDVKIAHFD